MNDHSIPWLAAALGIVIGSNLAGCKSRDDGDQGGVTVKAADGRPVTVKDQNGVVSVQGDKGLITVKNGKVTVGGDKESITVGGDKGSKP